MMRHPRCRFLGALIYVAVPLGCSKVPPSDYPTVAAAASRTVTVIFEQHPPFFRPVSVHAEIDGFADDVFRRVDWPAGDFRGDRDAIVMRWHDVQKESFLRVEIRGTDSALEGQFPLVPSTGNVTVRVAIVLYGQPSLQWFGLEAKVGSITYQPPRYARQRDIILKPPPPPCP